MKNTSGNKDNCINKEVLHPFVHLSFSTADI